MSFYDLIAFEVFGNADIFYFGRFIVTVLDNDISGLQQLIVRAVERNKELEISAVPIPSSPHKACNLFEYSEHIHLGIVNIQLHTLHPQIEVAVLNGDVEVVFTALGIVTIRIVADGKL